jgi:hypothetical protein
MEVQTFLTFYSVLNHSDIGKTFCNYLKKQNKEETWKFIVSSQLLEILVQKSNKTRATKQIKLILKNFFHEKQENTGNCRVSKFIFHHFGKEKNKKLGPTLSFNY